MESSQCFLDQYNSENKLAFYHGAIEKLLDTNVPFLVGGAYALKHYTGVTRDTKDLDVFVRPQDLDPILEAFAAAGYRTELTFPHWLGKVLSEDHVLDVIFNSGNGFSMVDDEWFEKAGEGDVVGYLLKLIPPEEMICSKAFIMERERYDGADIMHVILTRGKDLDWKRLIKRFGPHWAVLLSYLILFTFTYPSERAQIPEWVMHDLLERLQRQMSGPAPTERVCMGTLISHQQYLIDVECWGFKDGRLIPTGKMTQGEISHMTNMFRKKNGE